MSRDRFTPEQEKAALRVVRAALALDRRVHSDGNDWYRKTYHFAPTCDLPEWDEFDAALNAMVDAVPGMAMAGELYLGNLYYGGWPEPRNAQKGEPDVR